MLMKLAKLSSNLDNIESKQYLNWNNLNLKWNVCAVMPEIWRLLWSMVIEHSTM